MWPFDLLYNFLPSCLKKNKTEAITQSVITNSNDVNTTANSRQTAQTNRQINNGKQEKKIDSSINNNDNKQDNIGVADSVNVSMIELNNDIDTEIDGDNDSEILLKMCNNLNEKDSTNISNNNKNKITNLENTLDLSNYEI